MSGPTLTLSEAAKRSTVSESTLRRKLKANEIEDAERDETGAWAIPIASLVAAGVMSGTTPPDNTDDSAAVDDADDGRTALAGRITELEHRAQLAEIQRDAARAELLRADQTIEAQAQALRMLEAAPPPEEPELSPLDSAETVGTSAYNKPDPEPVTEAPDPAPGEGAHGLLRGAWSELRSGLRRSK